MHAGKKILIVDDSLIITSRLKDMLREMPNIAAVHSCGSVASAQEWIKSHHTDLVILDIDLPQRSGIELLRYIRRNDLRLVVIMHTTHSDPFFKTYCLAQGADFFVDKFDGMEELPGIISSLTPYSPIG